MQWVHRNIVLRDKIASPHDYPVLQISASSFTVMPLDFLCFSTQDAQYAIQDRDIKKGEYKRIEYKFANIEVAK